MDFVTDRTVQFIRELQQIGDNQQLVTFLSSTLADFGVSHFTLLELGGTSTPEKGVCGNFPPEWVERYIGQHYEYYDPVTIKIIRSKAPFDWKALGSERLLEGKSKRIFYEGAEFGLRDGCTFPIFNTNGYTAVISYATKKLDEDPKLFPAMQLISLYFHGKYRELRGVGDSVLPDLTPRERECLTWAGAGKTDWEIGEILSISETTAHSHIESAKRKLGVTTRIQAVVESLRHHLIAVDPQLL